MPIVISGKYAFAIKHSQNYEGTSKEIKQILEIQFVRLFFHILYFLFTENLWISNMSLEVIPSVLHRFKHNFRDHTNWCITVKPKCKYMDFIIL